MTIGPQPPDGSELRELLARLREQMLSAEESDRLSRLLRESDDAVRLYVRYVSLQADLAGRLGSDPLPHPRETEGPGDMKAAGPDEESPADRPVDPYETVYGFRADLLAEFEDWERNTQSRSVPGTFDRVPPGRPAARKFRPAFLGPAAAAIVLLVTGLFFRFRGAKSPVATGPLATVTALDGAEWQEEAEGAATGAALDVGRTLQLRRGFVQLTYRNGVRVLLQSPAAVTLTSPVGFTLDRGKATTRVPPALVGFTVATPTADVVDLGTEFGVEVTPAGAANIHVFVGKVRVEPKRDESASPVVLTAGATARADTRGVRITGATGMPTFSRNMPVHVTGGPTRPGGKDLPDNVLDDNPLTWWAGDPARDAWSLTFDLGQKRRVPSMAVRYVSSRYVPLTAVASGSLNGTRWFPLGAVPADGTMPLAREVRFVRIDMAGKVHGKQPAIWSVVFGEDAKEPLVLAEAPSSAGPPVPGWPAAVHEIAYRSSADGTDQPALFYDPGVDHPVPLLVALHTFDSTERTPEPDYARWCINRGWAMIRPNFRGQSNRPEACGSELVVRDILSAVEWAEGRVNVDRTRVYLVGVAGGGQVALLMAGRAPHIWAGVSAWSPIYDLRSWYEQVGQIEGRYRGMLEAACGGAPDSNAAAREQYRVRSPAAFLTSGLQVPIDLNTANLDRNAGNVPVAQTLRAFNALAAPADRLADSVLRSAEAEGTYPADQNAPTTDPLYRPASVVFRRQSLDVRLTVFSARTAFLPNAALAWLEQQRQGSGPVWDLKRSAEIGN